ncbi:hypothetical protein HDA32_003774 [Spinactinospora alkalitolerans]|uniref:PH domain-containing protein n=1 Tax=Spinactinospora alkalitolerans TaxID=687207 RepID=A0A852U3F0_9ACTN|nr:hypothetical protein [Spinactinospora alkalitolerans]NYE48654.1 hypothetical protein [Spinactinospora alkalitolerans]
MRDPAAEPERPAFRMTDTARLKAQAWSAVGIGAVFALMGVLMAAVVLTGVDPAALAAEPVAVAVVALVFLGGASLLPLGLLQARVVREAEVRLTPEGVVQRATRTRVIPWPEILDVQVVSRGFAWRVRLTLTQGRTATLVAPMTRRPPPDRQFAREVGTLREWWERHR